MAFGAGEEPVQSICFFSLDLQFASYSMNGIYSVETMQRYQVIQNAKGLNYGISKLRLYSYILFWCAHKLEANWRVELLAMPFIFGNSMCYWTFRERGRNRERAREKV